MFRLKVRMGLRLSAPRTLGPVRATSATAIEIAVVAVRRQTRAVRLLRWRYKRRDPTLILQGVQSWLHSVRIACGYGVPSRHG